MSGYVPAAGLTIATMPARIASGSAVQTVAILAGSGAISGA
jgi:hypothetical protein